MKDNLINFNLISFSVLFNLVVNLLIFAGLLRYQFELSETAFTVLMLLNLLISSMIAGKFSKKFGEIHGFFVGIVSVAVLLIMIYAKKPANWSWEVNALLAVIWTFIGFIGGYIGSKLNGKKREAQLQTEK